MFWKLYQVRLCCIVQLNKSGLLAQLDGHPPCMQIAVIFVYLIFGFFFYSLRNNFKIKTYPHTVSLLINV